MAAIVKQTGLAKFGGEGYLEWQQSMKAVLLEKELWEVVCDRYADRPGDDAEDSVKLDWTKKQGRAYGLLQLSLGTNMMVLVSHCKSAHDIWAELRRQLNKPSWTRRLRLRQSFHSLVMAEGTSVQVHIVRLKSLVDELAGMGDVVTEDLVVIQLLNSLPPSYHGLITALENIQVPTVPNATSPATSSTSHGYASTGVGMDTTTVGDLDDFDAVTPPAPFPLKLGYVTSTLLEEEERRTRLGAGVDGVKQLKGGPSAPKPPKEHKKRDKSQDECHFCGLKGHWERECRKKQQVKGKWKQPGHNKPGLVCQVNATGSGNSTPDQWLVDSGATRHVVNSTKWFTEYRSIHPKPIQLADSGFSNAVGEGTVSLEVKHEGEWVSVTLTQVLHVPGLSSNFFSVKEASQKQLGVVFTADRSYITKGSETLLSGPLQEDLYLLEARPVAKASVSMVREKLSLKLWHKRYGHLSPTTIKEMAKSNAVHGLTVGEEGVESGCETCVAANLARGPFKERPAHLRASTRMELVHTNVCSMGQTSLGGYNHFFSFTDHWSQKSWTYPIRYKGEVFGIFKQWLAEAENFSGRRLGTLRCDGGGEYLSWEFKRFLAQHGV